MTKKEKEAIRETVNPEKYRMACCPSCRGAGKSSDGDGGTEVCSQCGGFGWVKKEENHR